MGSDYLFTDIELSPNSDHPDAAIRLASVVHRFKLPKITRKVDFARSFQTVGQHDKTRRLMNSANAAREDLAEGLSKPKVSAEKTIQDAVRFEPLIHSILLSCKVQPEQARLDERLVFEWKSGIESKPKAFKSEAQMYDFVMDIATQGLGFAAAATEKSVTGDFAAASRDYAAAAGVFDALANDHLPKWIAKGSNVEEAKLPLECNAQICEALKILFWANGQQMAVATLLMKEGKPNLSLLAKLTLGVSELLEEFVATLRRDTSDALARLDDDFLKLVQVQIQVQKSLTLYFQARMLWDSLEYGLGIAMMSDATTAISPRDSASSEGLPAPTPGLKPLGKDLKDLREHMLELLRSWEKDNSSVYFTSVPSSVPISKKIKDGLQMKKTTEYKQAEAEPVLLKFPDGVNRIQRSDSDLARELQAKLNAS